MSLSFCAMYGTLSQRNHIALQIVDIEVVNIIIGNHAGLALRIVEKYEEENGWYDKVQ